VLVNASRSQITVAVSVTTCAHEIPKPLRSAAVVLVSRHRSAVQQAAAQAARREIEQEEMLDREPPDSRSALAQSFEADSMLATAPPPAIGVSSLLDLIPPGFSLEAVGSASALIDRLVIKAVLASPDPANPPPRDGLYRALVAGADRHKARIAVSWVPHRGPPSYAEVRAATERIVPRAFTAQRLTAVEPPFVDGGHHPGDAVASDASPFDPGDPGWLNAFGPDLRFDFPQRDIAADRVRQGQQAGGIEAVSWFQPHHVYGESAWGIYVDGPKLDDLFCKVSMDLSRQGLGGQTDPLAAKLVVGMLYEHQLFHAKVEAALTWLELQSGKAKFLRYQQQVYAATRGTDGCLEEGLANFWSWSWFSAESMMASLTGRLNSEQRSAVTSIVEANLDLSPHGYRRWREGRQLESWRTLATQAATGRVQMPKPRIGLPIETMLRDPLQFDFTPTDVPLRFVRTGQVASRILTAPATFNRPSRSELRSVITGHFGYSVFDGAGTGRHERFQGPQGATFPLPQRDPVSQDVFGAFLGHFGLTVAEYLNNVRSTI
jgi:hypothetical protein